MKLMNENEIYGFEAPDSNSAVDELYRIACSFRKAIEAAKNAREINEMLSFPEGCCTFASDLFQRFLVEECGIQTYYMSGRYGYGKNGESHAWLETKDGTVLDITGDQYKSKNLKFTEEVYVGPRNDGFHDSFELDSPVPYSVNNKMFLEKVKFDHRYAMVLKYLKLG